jgi:putative flippase GtrA
VKIETRQRRRAAQGAGGAVDGLPDDRSRGAVPGDLREAKQFFRYVGAGSAGTAGHYGVFLAGIALAPSAVLTASTAGAVTGALINYGLNYRYSFASRRPHREAFPRFALVAATVLAINWAVMFALTAAAVPALAAQLVATCTVLLTGYLLNRNWTFIWRMR